MGIKKKIYISTKPKILSLFLKDYYLILLLFILFHLVSDISDKLFEIVMLSLIWFIKSRRVPRKKLAGQ